MNRLIKRFFQSLWANIGTFLLALLMSLAVWVSSVVAEDPNIQRIFPDAIPLEIEGLESDLLVVSELPQRVEVELRTPETLWNRLISEAGAVRALIDLSGLGPGEYTLPIEVELGLQPVLVVEQFPAEVIVVVEELLVRQFPIHRQILGEPALGFQIDEIALDASVASVSGPRSSVERVAEVRAQIDVAEARESTLKTISLVAVDENDFIISNVTVAPASVQANLTFTQSGGYREVAVTVATVGQPASGYRLTSISVNPPTVTIFSEEPQLVASLPGFVRTQPLELTSLDEEVEVRLLLDLPEGVQVVAEQQSVLVLVGIAPIEGSIEVPIPVEVIGLSPSLSVTLSPDTVQVLLSGPLSVLENLSPEDVRFFVDLTGYTLGTYLIQPEFEILPEGVRVDSVNPPVIEIIIGPPFTPTATRPPQPTATPTP